MKIPQGGSIIKIIIIVILVLILLIPLLIIQSAILERRRIREAARDEVVDHWGGRPALCGPVLTVPYKLTRIENGRRVERVESIHFLPKTLQIEGELKPELRWRGIYRVPVYSAELRISGTFAPPDAAALRISPQNVFWDQAVISLELPDMRCLRERVELEWNGTAPEARGGQGRVGVYPGELWAPAAGLRNRSESSYPFSINLQINGGETLHFIPLGDESRVRLTSSWPSPSFTGAFLPQERRLDKDGFEASWRIPSLACGFPQQWLKGEVEPEILEKAAFGVELFLPVDAYDKTSRSVKYGILFILLPFLSFFLFETLSGKRVHPLQYLMTGFGVLMFYLLLLSLSEHLPFGLAYAISSLAVTALIAYYAWQILATPKGGMTLAPVLGVGYLFLYITLCSEDYALLIGSLGLFAALALLMILTRRVDWYSPGAGCNSSAPETHTAEDA